MLYYSALELLSPLSKMLEILSSYDAHTYNKISGDLSPRVCCLEKRGECRVGGVGMYPKTLGGSAICRLKQSKIIQMP